MGGLRPKSVFACNHAASGQHTQPPNSAKPPHPGLHDPCSPTAVGSFRPTPLATPDAPAIRVIHSEAACNDHTEVVRIALVLSSVASEGGAFTYEQALLKTLLRHSVNDDFVVYAPQCLHGPVKQVEPTIEVRPVRTGFFAKFEAFARSSAVGMNLLTLARLQKSGLERKMIREKVSLVYFLSPNVKALTIRNVPIITTVWDIGHLDLPFYPEISGGKYFLEREHYFRDTLRRSVAVVTDSSVLTQKISAYYGIAIEKVLVVPFSELVEELSLSTEPREDPEVSYDRVVLYPAQFWPHKRHLLLLRAFKRVLDREENVRLVLVGGNKGNRTHVEAEIKRLNLGKHVDILGFVPRVDLIKLMAQSEVVAYPSELGPTNLPPLEAEALGTRTVVSEVSSVGLPESKLRTIVQDQSPESWANAIICCLQNATDTVSSPETKKSDKSTGITNGLSQKQSRYSGVKDLLDRFKDLETHLEEWDETKFQRED